MAKTLEERINGLKTTDTPFCPDCKGLTSFKQLELEGEKIEIDGKPYNTRHCGKCKQYLVSKEAPSILKSKLVVKETTVISGLDSGKGPVVAYNCTQGKCDSTTAYVSIFKMQRADEEDVEIHECTKCGYKSRDTSQSSW